MNKVIKILLSVVIVSLSALIFPLKIHFEDSNNDVLQQECYAQNMILIKQIEQPIEESIDIVPINFEINAAIEEMNQKIADIESIKDKKEWFIAYKNILDEYSEVIDPPETIYDYFTDEELDLLFRVVQAEIDDEYLFEPKTNVASVIFNRLQHERFPDTLSEILVYDQFSPISDGRYKKVEVSEDTILACEYAFQIEDTTGGCLFFDSNNTLNYQFIMNDGEHNFYTYKDSRKDEWHYLIGGLEKE